MTPDRFLYLVEGLGDRLPYLKKEFPDMSEDDIVRIANSDPTEGKYVRWILYQVSQGNLRFPEDHEKVHTRLTQFDSIKKKRNFVGEKDINRYQSYGDLAQTIDQNSGIKTKGEVVRQNEIEGARLLAQKGDLAVYEITTVEAGLKLGWRDTEWCVKDPKYFDQYGPPYYMLTKSGKPHKLLHIKSEQLMDVYDRSTYFSGFEILGKQFIANDPDFAYYYAKKVIDRRFPEGEPAIAKDPGSASIYAHFLGKRFPEAEPIIKQDPEWAFFYTVNVIGQRWPEAEPTISKNAYWSYRYALHVIQGRWPEAEPTILEEGDWLLKYIHDVIQDRWLEAEPIIAKGSYQAYYYAINIINGRFPEGEPAIAKEPEWAYWYAKCIIKGRWPEGEPTISKTPKYAYWYAKNIIEDRWPEGELAIRQDHGLWKTYEQRFLS